LANRADPLLRVTRNFKLQVRIGSLGKAEVAQDDIVHLTTCLANLRSFKVRTSADYTRGRGIIRPAAGAGSYRHKADTAGVRPGYGLIGPHWLGTFSLSSDKTKVAGFPRQRGNVERRKLGLNTIWGRERLLL
jgi:hypothetical protein